MLTAMTPRWRVCWTRRGLIALLVGDSVGMVVLGYDNTLAVTLDDMLHHTRAVVRGTVRWSSPTCRSFRIRSARGGRSQRRTTTPGGGRFGRQARRWTPGLEAVRRMVDVGIPVMGHLGLQPQSVHQLGGYIKQPSPGRR